MTGGLEENQAALVDDEEGYELANLYPRTTGLPMTIWCSQRGNARQDARVKVSTVGGNRMVTDGAAVVAIRPSPALVAGDLSTRDLAAVAQWIELNRAVLIEYWEGTLDTLEFGARLQRV